MEDFTKDFIHFVREWYETEEFIPLHIPRFVGKEKEYLNQCIDSTFVSSVGEFVNRFEEVVCQLTGAKHAVAATNGTVALHMALHLLDVKRGDLVLTSPLTFVASSNAIAYTGAEPFFLDVDHESLGLCPDKLEAFLSSEVGIENGYCVHKPTKRRIKACVPIHIFGHPCQIDHIVKICEKYLIPVVEDAAESLGSFYQGKHTGTFGKLGIFSFNGNKTITCGGGGVIVTDDENLALRAKHITTTAKVPHRWEYRHDEIGYNYRMPNLNAALACAQLENLKTFLDDKRKLSLSYREFVSRYEKNFHWEPEGSSSNFWLNAIVFSDREERDSFLEKTNENGIMTRPIWCLMHKLAPFKNCYRGSLDQAEFFESRVVNIPSSAREVIQ